MRRALPRPLLPALALLLAVPASATNTDEEGELRVTLFDGTVYQGKVKLKKATLDLVSGKKAKLRWKDIASLEDAPPPGEEEKQKDRAQLEKRKELLKPDDASGWARVARWARDQGLVEEAGPLYEKALAIDPEHAASRAALGFSKDGEKWVKTVELLGPEAQKLAATDLDGRVALARRAIKGGAEDLAFQLLRDTLLRDQWHKEALEVMRPLTMRYRQTTRLKLPVRGRWHASKDPSDHHGLKGYAVYALDLNQLDAQGKSFAGDGKRLEDHLCFGKPFYAVADGKVVSAHDGQEDNPPWTIPPAALGETKDAMTHNGVAIMHENGEGSWYIHARKGSVKVKVGDVVKQGDLLGEVGNSGRSALPHLHFTLVNFGGLSVPWACDDWTLIAEDGTPVKVIRGFPREGWTFESRDP